MIIINNRIDSDINKRFWIYHLRELSCQYVYVSESSLSAHVCVQLAVLVGGFQIALRVRIHNTRTINTYHLFII